MADLTHKKRVRGGHRGVVTRRLHEVKVLVESDDRPDGTKLAQQKLMLQEKLEILRQLDKEMVDLIEDEDALINEIEEADLFNQELYEMIVKIDHLSNPPTTTPTTVGAMTGPSHTHASSGKAKLPKLSLKSFDGDITKWATFWDCYRSAIHDNESLSDVDRFTYLKSLVERSAKESIDGLTLTSANYHEATSILERRFGNRQQIISKHGPVAK